MRGLLALGLFFLLLPFVMADVYINEVMYDPSGSDTGREWIELANNGSCENLTQWRLHEAGTNHILSLIQGNATICQNQYVVIADNSASFLSEYALFNGTLFDSTFSLLNTNETLVLKNSSLVTVHNMTYFSQSGSSDTGMSLEFISGTWLPSIAYGGTPGIANGQGASQTNSSASSGGLNITVIAGPTLYLGFTYDSLFKITNLDYPAVTGINATVHYNITNSTTIIKQDYFNITGLNSYKTADTGEFIPNSTGTFTICGRINNSTMQDNNTYDDSDCKQVQVLDPSTIPCNVSLSITTNQTVYLLGNTIKFDNQLSNTTFPFIIEYWVEDLFGTIIKNKVNTTNLNQKTWTPDFEEEENAYLIKSNIAWIACNDSYKNDNSYELLVAVRGQIAVPEQNSSILIDEADNETEFGDVAFVEARLYKGNTSAYAITAEIKQGSTSVSEDTKFYAFTKFTNYSVRLPIQTNNNCDGKYADGTYTLTVSGLGKSASRQIWLHGRSAECNSSGSSSSSQFRYGLLTYPKEITSGQEFTSKVFIESDEKDHELEIYSYVYRGSKSYSGERDANLQKVLLGKDSSVTVELKNTAYVSEEGEYNFKVKIKKDDLKTEKELTAQIQARIDKSAAKTSEEAINLESARDEESAEEEKRDYWYFNRVDEPVRVFLSPSYKAKQAMLYSLLGLAVLLSIATIILKKLT